MVGCTAATFPIPAQSFFEKPCGGGHSNWPRQPRPQNALGCRPMERNAVGEWKISHRGFLRFPKTCRMVSEGFLERVKGIEPRSEERRLGKEGVRKLTNRN